MRFFEPDDLKYLWATYRKGGLAEYGYTLPEGLDPEQFRGFMARNLASLNAIWTVIGPVAGHEQPIPVCMVAGVFNGLARQVLTLHALWFPWATARNKIECTVDFINRMRGMHRMVLPALRKDVKFFTHVCRYGVAKRAGTLVGFAKDGGDLALFQSKDLI